MCERVWTPPASYRYPIPRLLPARVGLLVNPNFPATDAQTRDATDALLFGSDSIFVSRRLQLPRWRRESAT
jgi:hypothetical protein